MSLAGIAAVTWPAFTNVVGRPVPFQRTWEVPTKLLPFTVSVNAAPPAGVLVGASDVSVGFTAPPMVNDKAFEAAVILIAHCFAVPGIGSPNTMLVQAVPLVRLLKKYD